MTNPNIHLTDAERADMLRAIWGAGVENQGSSLYQKLLSPGSVLALLTDYPEAIPVLEVACPDAFELINDAVHQLNVFIGGSGTLADLRTAETKLVKAYTLVTGGEPTDAPTTPPTPEHEDLPTPEHEDLPTPDYEGGYKHRLWFYGVDEGEPQFAMTCEAFGDGEGKLCEHSDTKGRGSCAVVAWWRKAGKPLSPMAQLVGPGPWRLDVSTDVADGDAFTFHLPISEDKDQA